MALMTRFRAAGYASCLILLLGTAGAEAQNASDYTPERGQAGKDVVWVPTPQALVDRMLDAAKVTPDDYVVDLGSGDGRTVITAAKRGVRALGVEYNPDLVALSKRAAAQEGVEDKVTFVQGDIFKTDFSDATVVTLFLLPELNVRLRPTLLDMKPGTRVVSNSFDMAEWKPDERLEAGEKCEVYCVAYLWIVPAKVEGTWRFPNGELSLKQTFQTVSGTLTSNGKEEPIADGRLNGNVLSFTAGGGSYTAQISGGSMRIEPAAGHEKDSWTATRRS
jgi:SAM-dependent methyltransferase